MSDADTTLESLRSRIHTFVRDRDWERFHNPKDLAAAIAIEAAELMELCLWKDLSEIADLVKDRDHRKALEEELADIIILSLSLANRLQIDVADAVTSKLAVNETKYPAQLVRGKAHKYTKYTEEG